MDNKKYYEEIDIIRGIAILLVVTGHGLSDVYNGTYTSGWNSLFAKYCFILIYSFHMPLFIYISGFCNARICSLKDSKERYIFVIKKFRRLMVPYLIWGIIYVFLDVFVGNYSWSDFSIKQYLIELLKGDNANWQLWTLYTLFVCSLLSILLLNILCISITKVALCSGIIFVLYLIASTLNILPLILYRTIYSTMLQYYFFFVMGIITYQRRILSTHQKCSNQIFSVSFIILLLNSIVAICLINSGISSDWSKIIGSIFGIFILLETARRFSNYRIKRAFSFLGSYSMSIYLLANICQDFVRLPVRKQLIPKNFLFIILFISVGLGIIIPIFIDKYIISRSKLMSMLLLGKS